MRVLSLPLLIALFTLTSCFQIRNTQQGTYSGSPPVDRGPQKIQIALLLDTSGSMDDLLEQAKTEFWYLVDELMYAYDGYQAPRLEIALYEYGNKRLGRNTDYIRMAVPLTSDLDWIASELWNLRPKGRKEYAGMVIDRAVEELDWSRNSRDIRMIFIAGNESFHRGPVNPRRAIDKACDRGIEVHTLFAGNYETGYELGWEEAGSYCGTYSALDLSRRLDLYPTVYDAQIVELNVFYNQTFLPYGAYGRTYYDRCLRQDRYFRDYGNPWMAIRTAVKCGPYYTNPHWDLIDALDAGYIRLEDIPYADLPPELRGLTRYQQMQIIERYRNERKKLRKQILELNNNRRREIEVRRPAPPTRSQVNQRASLNETIVNRVRTKADPRDARTPDNINRTRTQPDVPVREPVRVDRERTEPTRPTRVEPNRERQAETDRQRKQAEAKRQAELDRQRREASERREAELDRQRKQAEAKRQAELDRQRREASERREAELDRQRKQAEAKRQAELDRQRREASERREAELDRQRKQAEAKRQAELDRQRREASERREAELDRQRKQAEAKRQAELDRQRREATERREAELDRQRKQAEAKRQAELDRQRREATERREAELDRQRKQAEAKRQAELDRQRREATERREAEQARQRREAEERRQAEQARQRREAAERREAEQARQRREAEARREAEQARQRREAEARRQAEQQRAQREAAARKQAEQARQQREAEQRKAQQAKRKPSPGAAVRRN